MAKYGFKTHSKEYEELFEQEVSKAKDEISQEIYKLFGKALS